MKVKALRILTYITLTLSALTGCRSSHPSVSDRGQTTGSPKERMEALAATYASSPLRPYSVPVTLNLLAPSNAKVSGTMYVAPDKYIYFSARFLGIEVGNVMITPDSVFARIKPGKMYLAESSEAVTKILPVTLGQLQDLMLGRVVIPGHPVIDRNAIADCRLKSGDGQWTISPNHMPKGIAMTYIMDSSTDHIAMLVAEADGNKATMSQDNFRSTTFGELPQEITLRAAAGKKDLSASMTFNYSKLNTDAKVDKSWTTPKGYTRVTAAQVMKALSNL
ncbi:MAG: DUF4292 domain-containing protein [Bacteroides sp.]|nr:DUF4292 domain-containing protein [Bacteroides sp.]